MQEFDVAIVGAGPAGCAAAITLAQRGHAVMLIDRAVFPRDKLCGDFVNPINWPILQQLGVSEALLGRRHVKVSSFRLTSADGAEANSPLAGDGGQLFGLGIRRYDFDQALMARAKNVAVSVKEETRLRGVERNTRGWSLSFDRHGDRQSIKARFLVGADGRNSALARRLGLESESLRPVPASVGFQIHLTQVPGVCGSVEIHQFPGGYAGVVRLDADTVNLCFAAIPLLLPRPVSYENLHRRLLSRNPFLREMLARGEPASQLRSAWPVGLAKRRAVSEASILVGDAARVTEPITGEGIFFALRSGQLGAQTIALALQKNDPSAACLSRYERACRAELGGRWRVNYLLRALAQRPKVLPLSIRFLARRRELFQRLVQTICLRRSAVGIS